LCKSAISVPQIGRPVMKARVPSIGSSTQTYSASARSTPCSSPYTPCSGTSLERIARIAASASRSAIVTGLASLLSSTGTGVRK
jgi:hypothetical protein